MNLGFKTSINNKPTHFVEKIWTGFPVKIEDWDKDYETLYYEKFGYPPEPVIPPAKIHSIRSDPNGRWKPGMNIHFIVGNRTKHRFQFAPLLPVVSIQRIKIKPNAFNKVWIMREKDGHESYWPIWSHDEIEQLIRNDGLDSIEEFFEWFKEGFEGIIIHWTDKTY